MKKNREKQRKIDKVRKNLAQSSASHRTAITHEAITNKTNKKMFKVQ